MNISALNAPATPPYDYQNHTNTDNKNYSDIFFDRRQQHTSSDHHHPIEISSATIDNETATTNHSAFRRVSTMSMPSPPELLIDTSEDEEEDASSYTSSSPSASYTMHYRSRKSVPHRSPSNFADHKSIVFQIDVKNSQPKILGGGHSGLLWSLRQRVSMARRQHKNRLSAPHPERRVRAMRIQIPRPQWSNSHNQENDTLYDDLASHHHHLQQEPTAPVTILHNMQPMTIDSTTQPQQQTWQPSFVMKKVTKPAVERKKSSSASSTPRKNSSGHASSGRPSRVKGPCQACHETSDGCMRKAFNWPFLTSTIFNDKGKPFVYLCNKCGLRYNKSGGCVCRHCRWVLCKEEKRKAMQLIDQMRRSRPDGRVDLDEDIENFACSPKYWSCGRPWKVGWVLDSQHDEADDEEDSFAHQSPSLSEATL